MEPSLKFAPEVTLAWSLPVPFFITKLITPAIASEPYCAAAPSLRTSSLQ
ncbi:hypothetical protein [Flavobacterium sp.]|nr:hypothetical protein [Flavobacterium sp.]